MKISIFLFSFLLCFLSIVTDVRAAAPPAIETSAQQAVLMEQDSGRVLYAKNEHEPQKIASITKIMTALLAIESGKMKETVEVSNNASGVEGSSLYLKPGEKIQLKDLTYGLMLRSGNDAAAAIAEHVGGSMDGFIYMMNEKASELGMNNTQFTNPHGLDDGDQHYSSAYDMALLMQYAMNNKTFREISGTESYRAPQEGEEWDRIWNNKNKLLTSLYEYCTGGKTGYTKSAGRTLVTTAEKDGLSLIAVTLDAPSDWNDHTSMFEWAFEHVKKQELASENEKITIGSTEYTGTLYLPYTLTYPVISDGNETFKRKMSVSREFMEKTDAGAVGEMKWYLNEEQIHSMPIMYEPEIKENNGFWKKLLPFFVKGGDAA
ncbi:D-alanyl-D-alanine carboxypeptidase family protein [Alteribacillus sp. HJP-4]|uniref:D-alanyl-D-alanine carboxypeptidase family protein n=1 Tax=Alteribacillus sp. HJP-4 TaxID=2775394 RepID=UPI0035CCFA02